METSLPSVPWTERTPLSLSLLSSSVSNVILAFCLDGNVYALDERSGRVLWRLNEAFTSGPLLQHSVAVEKDLKFLIEPIGDGALFSFNQKFNTERSLQRLPYSLKQIVQQSPVRLEAEESLFLIGKRESSLFAVDLVTGLVTCKGFNSANEKESDADEVNSERSLLIGRSDFHLQVYDAVTLKPLWTGLWTQFKSVTEETASSDEWSFYPSFEGFLVAKSPGKQAWMTRLSSPVLQLFRPVKLGSAFSLQEVELDAAKSANLLNRHVQFDRNSETFYFDELVNLGVIDGALFLLPQSRYPILQPKADLGNGNTTKSMDENGILLHSSSGSGKFIGSHRIVRQVVAEPIPLLDASNGIVVSGLLPRLLGTGLILLATFIILYILRLRKRKFQYEVTEKTTLVLDVSDEVLGYGSHGTIVYRGKFDGRSVAVKRLLADFFDMADREIGLLLEHDTHPNIIRYFYRERTDKFIFIALELASLTLQEWIEEGASGGNSSSSHFDSSQSPLRPVAPKEALVAFSSLSSEQKIQIFEQIMKGVAFLHSVNLIHRDLKPQNILVKFDDISGAQVLISDFGLSKRLIESESSFHATAASGTLGWRAPELIFNEESVSFMRSQTQQQQQQPLLGPMKIGKSLDIFAAGLVLYYILSGGEHPFGSKLIRESNIVSGKLQLRADCLSPEAEDLVKKMLRAAGKERPSAEAVLKHPLFWTPKQQLAFICAVSDALEGEERQAKAAEALNAPPGFTPQQQQQQQQQLPMREAINTCAAAVFPSGQNCWHKSLDRPVFADLTRHRFYLVACVHDLLRVIRNKRNHFSETPSAIQELLGTSPEAAWLYFKARFPRLLIEVYRIMARFKGDLDGSLESFY